MRWPWQAIQGEPGTAMSLVPEPWGPEIAYQWRILADGISYHWWKCNRCGHEVGACGITGNLKEAVLRHIRECKLKSCGESSCINCLPPVVVFD